MGNCFGFSPKTQGDTRSLDPGLSNSKISSGSAATTTTTTTTTTGKLSNFSNSTFGQSTGSNVSADEVFPEGRILEVPNLRVFTYSELRSATRNFKPENVLGEGGFGRVYKGLVEERTLNPSKSGTGMVVAVKKLNPESMQGFDEWQAEINFLGRLSHPNLVKLMGYCLEDKELLIVYEYLPKGSLENHLFRRGAVFEPFSWDTRLKIAIGAARGLAFLHSSERQVIYRDFKASNILLDVNYNAKLSDFGLAKYGPMGGASHVTTRVMGTYGYAAPEYVATGHLYVKSDVYGFGVVLLEMLTGQRAMDTNRPSGQHKLVDWAMPMLGDRRKIGRLMDSRLEGQYSSKGAYQAIQLTLRCLAGEPKNRPSMKQVVETLENIGAITTRSKNAAPRPMARGRDHTPMHSNSPLHPRKETSARSNIEVAHQTRQAAT